MDCRSLPLGCISITSTPPSFWRWNSAGKIQLWGFWWEVRVEGEWAPNGPHSSPNSCLVTSLILEQKQRHLFLVLQPNLKWTYLCRWMKIRNLFSINLISYWIRDWKVCSFVYRCVTTSLECCSPSCRLVFFKFINIPQAHIFFRASACLSTNPIIGQQQINIHSSANES